ncbi:TetR/AcrR family transcriptional regulator [Sulfurimonas sp.]|uniref:TetR/AcrR family transcriptional regulator n=1 Tax=Sulfurimonas sp. TaxID=2022749 RepID=UPI00286D6C3E|nr:TetR/AcrR family transcriptional regulator [Sulfurimonas sp.]
MAIIVDKVQKRKDIALSCKGLFFQNGIKDLTISEVAKTAGIGKGTIYEYFKNKEDIVFEIVNILLLEHDIRKNERIENLNSTKEKIKEFFTFFYNEEDAELRELYKEFISISLTTPNEEMIEFQSQCSKNYFNWFENIIQEGIDRGELAVSSKNLARGVFVFGEGIFISSVGTNTIVDVKEEIDKFVDTLFEFIEVKR